MKISFHNEELDQATVQQKNLEDMQGYEPGCINEIQKVFIQPNDFIFENIGNIRDHYRIGQKIGTGTYA